MEKDEVFILSPQQKKSTCNMILSVACAKQETNLMWSFSSPSNLIESAWLSGCIRACASGDEAGARTCVEQVDGEYCCVQCTCHLTSCPGRHTTGRLLVRLNSTRSGRNLVWCKSQLNCIHSVNIADLSIYQLKTQLLTETVAGTCAVQTFQYIHDWQISQDQVQ